MASKEAGTVGGLYGKQEEIRSYKEDTSWVLPTTMIGVELELEGVKTFPKFSGPQYWETKEDGSLRDIDDEGSTSMELVFAIPLCGYDLTKALSILKHTLDKQKYKPVVSPRCSTHIHIDVRELNFNKLLNLLIIYTIVERPLYHYCGNDRENNNFCLPFYKAESRVFNAISQKDILGTKDRLVNITSGDRRYSGLNLCSLQRFGSLEFRQLPGTTDVDKITQWINIIMCIKKAALDYTEELQTLPVSFSEKGIEKNVKEIFGEYYPYIKYPELEYDVLQGIRQAQDIIYESKMDSEEQTLVEKMRSDNPVYYNKILEKFNLKGKKIPDKKEAKIKASYNYSPNVWANFDLAATEARIADQMRVTTSRLIRNPEVRPDDEVRVRVNADENLEPVEEEEGEEENWSFIQGGILWEQIRLGRHFPLEGEVIVSRIERQDEEGPYLRVITRNMVTNTERVYKIKVSGRTYIRV